MQLDHSQEPRGTAAGVVSSEPYGALAEGYDFVMRHVEYDEWAEYLVELLDLTGALDDTTRVLELGCGTGSLAVALMPFGPWDYVAGDKSEAMLRQARKKFRAADLPVTVRRMDFSDFTVEETPFDLVLLLYDGLNYLVEDDDIRSFLRCSFDALRPGGLLIFDQSTPANSINHESEFDDEGRLGGFDYIRRSRYNRDTRLHTTEFEIRTGERHFVETHVQKALEMEEVRERIDESGFVCEAVYDEFTDEPATPGSERVHWVLRRPFGAGS